MPLNICYRCPENVVKLARLIVPQLEWNTSREDKGDVSVITQQEMYSGVDINDLIICRKNSDVMDLYTKLAFDMHKPVSLVNRDLVTKLTNEIKYCISQYLKYYKLGYNIQVELKNRMDEYIKASPTPLTSAQYKEIRNGFISELLNENNKSKAKVNVTVPTIEYLKLCMQDYVDNGNYTVDTNCMTTLYFDKIVYLIKKYEYANKVTPKTSVESFEKYLPQLFKYNELNNTSIIISSIHQMKGGEADNVYIYDYPSFPYQFQSMSDEQALQETNLQYVALTRAKKNLSLVLMDSETCRAAERLNAECIAEVNMLLK